MMVRQVVEKTLGVDVALRMMEKWRTQHEKDKSQVLCDLTESPLVPKPAHRGLVVGTGDLELLRLPFWRRGGGGSGVPPGDRASEVSAICNFSDASAGGGDDGEQRATTQICDQH